MTPEEKQKIYEEEKARIEVQAQLKTEAVVAKKKASEAIAKKVLVVLFIIGALIFVLVQFAADSSSPSPTVAATVKKTALDKSPKMQADRAKFIGKMLADRVFSNVKQPNVYVTPLFLEGNIQDKEKIISAVYAYFYDGTNDLDSVELLDSRTGKSIGTYSISRGGLKMY